MKGTVMLLAIWRIRWNLIRLFAAAFCLWTLGVDTAARAGRLALANLPGFDYIAEVRTLRAQGRFDEALLVADAGLRNTTGDTAKTLIDERELAQKNRDSTLRMFNSIAAGAVTGKGDSLEGLAGAVVADFFVVGDIRDLAIQGYNAVTGKQTDEVIVLLSTAGLVTTLAPLADWAPAVLKALRRSGAMSERLAEALIKMIRSERKSDLAKVFEDVDDLAKRASPVSAMAILKHADSPEDIAALAKFAGSREGASFALYATGREGAQIVRTIEAGTAAARTVARAGSRTGENVVSARRASDAVMVASTKGTAGRAFLRSKAARAMMKPHALVGITKGIAKGTLGDMLSRAVERLDPKAWWIVPLLAAWCGVEVVWIVKRVRGKRVAASPSHVEKLTAGEV